MSNPNPLIPQGSLLDQQAKSKPHLRIAICIVVIHLVFLGGLLMQGCKRDSSPNTARNAFTNDYLPPLGESTNLLASTNLGPLATTNEPGAGMPPGGAPPALVPPTPSVGQVAEPPSVPSAQEYTVVAADSFSSIGRKFGVSVSAISKANPGVVSTRLQIGQKLHIPAAAAGAGVASLPGGTGEKPQTYTVKSNDTLTKIARAHGTTIAAIKELNGLQTDRINVGQKLKLPTKVSSATETLPAPPTAAPPPGTLAPPTPGSPIPN